MNWRPRRPHFWAIGAIAAIAAATGFHACSATPPLASNLPADFGDAEKEFDRRIQTEFPIGSSTDKVSLELTRQGFKASPDCGDSPSTHVNSFHKGSFPCDLVWNVVWRDGADGKVTAMKGVYFAACP